LSSSLLKSCHVLYIDGIYVINQQSTFKTISIWYNPWSVLLYQTNGERTVNERFVNGEQTLNKQWTNDERRLYQRFVNGEQTVNQRFVNGERTVTNDERNVKALWTVNGKWFTHFECFRLFSCMIYFIMR
jgi:hypothetical protein